jgi:hypothetical protein
MFKFDFDLDGEELGDGDALGIPAQAGAAAIQEDVPELACVEITLAELVSFHPCFPSLRRSSRISGSSSTPSRPRSRTLRWPLRLKRGLLSR